MTENVSSILLENYDVFIKDHNDLFDDALSAVSTITDDSYYEMYIDKLTEGLEESLVRRIKPILDREREMYIEEATSILTSPQAIAYAVASFPMLINIYADPMLAKVVTVYPYDKPTMTIPRLRWVAKVIDEVGNATEYLFPTATRMVRPQFKEITTNQSDNLFDIMFLQKGDFRISKRNFKIFKLNVTHATLTEIIVNAPADARGNVMHEFEADGGKFKLQAQIDFETGDVTWSVVQLVAPANAITFDTAVMKFRMFGNGTGKQVVKSYPRQDIIDVDADIEDSFEVENLEEVIQDWKALYDLNILAELKNHVKDQIKLNRDYEIAELLETNMTFAATIGQLVTVDLSSFVGTGTGQVRPTTVQDIFKNIVPPMNALLERMRRQNNMDVQYLVCGIETAAILKSLQEFSIRMEGMTGQTGMTGTSGAFGKLEIVESYAVQPDLLHFVTEAPSLGQSSIVQVMYKPLYIITETTNSIRRTFIKSRTWIGVVRPEGIGTIQLAGYDSYFGQFDNLYMP